MTDNSDDMYVRVQPKKASKGCKIMSFAAGAAGVGLVTYLLLNQGTPEVQDAAILPANQEVEVPLTDLTALADEEIAATTEGSELNLDEDIPLDVEA